MQSNSCTSQPAINTARNAGRQRTQWQESGQPQTRCLNVRVAKLASCSSRANGYAKPAIRPIQTGAWDAREIATAHSAVTTSAAVVRHKANDGVVCALWA